MSQKMLNCMVFSIIFFSEIISNLKMPSMINNGAVNSNVVSNLYQLPQNYFFLSRLSFADTDGSQDKRKREGTIFYFALPFPP